MKWLLSLVLVTLFFLVISFFITKENAFAFRWMTMGMAAVAFLFYYTVNKNHKNKPETMLGSYLTAVILKFGLSALVIVLYAILFGMKGNSEFVFFFVAYFMYSIVMYAGAYRNR